MSDIPVTPLPAAEGLPADPAAPASPAPPLEAPPLVAPDPAPVAPLPAPDPSPVVPEPVPAPPEAPEGFKAGQLVAHTFFDPYSGAGGEEITLIGLATEVIDGDAPAVRVAWLVSSDPIPATELSAL